MCLSPFTTKARNRLRCALLKRAAVAEEEEVASACPMPNPSPMSAPETTRVSANNGRYHKSWHRSSEANKASTGALCGTAEEATDVGVNGGSDAPSRATAADSMCITSGVVSSGCSDGSSAERAVDGDCSKASKTSVAFDTAAGSRAESRSGLSAANSPIVW